MSTRTALRAALVLDVVVVVVGLVIKFHAAAVEPDPAFSGAFGRLLNEVCYFTIQSNVLVGVVCLAFAFDPSRSSRVWSVLRLTGLVCITITGVVYHLILAGDQHYTGLDLVGDHLVHTVSPIVYVATWLVLGPRTGVARSALVRSVLAYPLAWVVLALVRGAVTGIYPYGFVDVGLHGYVSVLLTIGVLLSAAAAMASGAAVVERRSPLVRPAAEVAGTRPGPLVVHR